jgi:carboxylesterase
MESAAWNAGRPLEATNPDLEATMPFSPTYDVPEERRAYTMLAGPVGCLMLHGFMGSPASSRPLAGYLAERGISVHCPLLPGHGQLPNKMYKIPREAWIAEAEEALTLLQKHCDQIFLMGHSMGTALSAHLACVGANSGESDFAGVIMLAPAYNVPDGRIQLLRVVRYVMPWLYPLKMGSLKDLAHERLLEFDPSLDFDEPAVQARLPEMSRVPTSAIDEMRKMVDAGRELWPKLDLPAIIFQGGRDIAVSLENTEKLYALLPNEDKQLIVFGDAGHELMRPFEAVHAEVWPAVYEFIRLRSGSESLKTSRTRDILNK